MERKKIASHHILSCPLLDYIILVAIMIWTGEHRGFTVQAYFENNLSVITTQ